MGFGITPPPAVLPQNTTGTLKDALSGPQGFLTGTLTLDADYDVGLLRVILRKYGTDNTIAFYIEPDKEATTPYNTPGGISFGTDFKTYREGYESWGRNAVDAGRELFYLLPEKITSDYPDFSLTYTSYGYFRVDTSGNNGSGRERETWFYFGIPTAPSDIPRTGSAYYTGIAEGSLYEFNGEYKLKGTATLTADFAAGNLETTLVLSSNGPSGNPGILDGVAKIASGANTFQGIWLASTTGYEGSLSGAFFGPSAAEFGYTFGIYKPDFSVLGGGVVVGGQDTSAPPPPPPPPPPIPDPPPPPPPGAIFPLAGEQTFSTISASMSYTGSFASGGITPGPIGTSPFSDQLQITVTPDYANGTYTVRDGSSTSAFYLADLVPLPDPGKDFVSLTDGAGDQLTLFNNLAPDIGTNNLYRQLHYLSYAFLFQNDADTSEHKTTALLFGIPTPAADLPRSGTANYQVQGIAYATRGFGNYADVGGDLTADFAAGTVENTFTLSNYRSASLMAFYRVSGSGSIASGTAFFSGPLISTDGTLTGDYSGSFFGANAEEAGFTFALSGLYNGQEQRIVGAAGGKR